LNANGVGIFKKKRLRDLMAKETCRQKVANRFLLEISDDKKSEIVFDVVSHLTLITLLYLQQLWCGTEMIKRGLLKGVCVGGGGGGGEVTRRECDKVEGAT
jgi:hypothetical protein